MSEEPNLHPAYDEPRTLEALQWSIGLWGDDTFPNHHDEQGVPDPRGPLAHLTDAQKGEVFELVQAVAACDFIRTEDELADCFILLCEIAHLTNISLYEAVNRKMRKNRKRKWGPVDENGISNHLPETE